MKARLGLFLSRSLAHALMSLASSVLAGAVLRLSLSTLLPSLCALLESRTELTTPLLSWLRRSFLISSHTDEAR